MKTSSENGLQHNFGQRDQQTFQFFSEIFLLLYQFVLFAIPSLLWLHLSASLTWKFEVIGAYWGILVKSGGICGLSRIPWLEFMCLVPRVLKIFYNSKMQSWNWGKDHLLWKHRLRPVTRDVACESSLENMPSSQCAPTVFLIYSDLYNTSARCVP